jgi:hypothetical protein
LPFVLLWLDLAALHRCRFRQRQGIAVSICVGVLVVDAVLPVVQPMISHAAYGACVGLLEDGPVPAVCLPVLPIMPICHLFPQLPSFFFHSIFLSIFWSCVIAASVRPVLSLAGRGAGG